MILDKELMFSDGQALTATAASTNVLDLGAARNVGVGESLFIVAVLTVAMTDSGSDSTVAVTVETDDNEGFATAATRQTVGTFTAASAAGSKLVARIAPELMNERFVRLKYTMTGGDLTTGTVKAFIAPGADLYTAYADNISIQ